MVCELDLHLKETKKQILQSVLPFLFSRWESEAK